MKPKFKIGDIVVMVDNDEKQAEPFLVTGLHLVSYFPGEGTWYYFLANQTGGYYGIGNPPGIDEDELAFWEVDDEYRWYIEYNLAETLEKLQK